MLLIKVIDNSQNSPGSALPVCRSELTNGKSSQYILSEILIKSLLADVMNLLV